MKGDKEERNGGTVYVRWGHDQCPSTAQLVYSGRTGGSYYQHGGACNPQCLPLDPNFLTPISGTQDRSLMYGAEYHTLTDSSYKAVVFMAETCTMYLVQFAMPLNVLQSTCSQPSIPVLVDGPENTMGI